MARQGGSSRCSQDPRYEQRVQEALRSLNDGTYKTLAAAARAHGVCDAFFSACTIL
jgi:hypothetical protein